MSLPKLLWKGNVEENYENLWIIPKWSQVSQNKKLLKSHVWKFQTAGKESKIETTWKVEWKLVPVLKGSPTKSCQVHWTLIGMKGMTGGRLQAKIKTSVIKNSCDGSPDLNYQSDEQKRYFQINETAAKSFCWISEDVLKPDGNLLVQLNLTLLLPKKTKVSKDGVKVKKINGQKWKHLKRKQPAICWYDEWHKAGALGSGNLLENTSAGDNNCEAGTSSRAVMFGNESGRKRNKKKSKRIGKNDLMVNQGLKKIKLESDYSPLLKKEVEGDELGTRNTSGTLSWEEQDLRIFEEIIMENEDE